MPHTQPRYIHTVAKLSKLTGLSHERILQEAMSGYLKYLSSHNPHVARLVRTGHMG